MRRAAAERPATVPPRLEPGAEGVVLVGEPRSTPAGLRTSARCRRRTRSATGSTTCRRPRPARRARRAAQALLAQPSRPRLVLGQGPRAARRLASAPLDRRARLARRHRPRRRAGAACSRSRACWASGSTPSRSGTATRPTERAVRCSPRSRTPSATTTTTSARRRRPVRLEREDRRPKVFYVSPFIGMQDGRYEFRVSEPGEKLRVAIYDYVSGPLTLIACHRSGRNSLSPIESLFRTMLRLGPMSARAWILIHLQAIQNREQGHPLHPQAVPSRRGDHAVSDPGTKCIAEFALLAASRPESSRSSAATAARACSRGTSPAGAASVGREDPHRGSTRCDRRRSWCCRRLHGRRLGHTRPRRGARHRTRITSLTTTTLCSRCAPPSPDCFTDSATTLLRAASKQHRRPLRPRQRLLLRCGSTTR